MLQACCNLVRKGRSTCVLFDMWTCCDMPMWSLLQDRCSSFDIALEVGKKIESLQVATCEASSEKDKTLDSTKSASFLMEFGRSLSFAACVIETNTFMRVLG